MALTTLTARVDQKDKADLTFTLLFLQIYVFHT